jgi:hypothetical protein
MTVLPCIRGPRRPGRGTGGRRRWPAATVQAKAVSRVIHAVLTDIGRTSGGNPLLNAVTSASSASDRPS